MNSHRPEFIADTMLQGLGKWLRFIGFSTVIADNFKMARLLLLANPSLIFITSSSDHLRELGEFTAFMVRKNSIAEQLQEIDNHFHIFQRLNLFTICSLCNIPAQPISREEIRDRIPEAVKNNFENFWICPGCQRIYWQGGHIQRLLEKMQRMGIPIQ